MLEKLTAVEHATRSLSPQTPRLPKSSSCISNLFQESTVYSCLMIVKTTFFKTNTFDLHLMLGSQKLLLKAELEMFNVHKVEEVRRQSALGSEGGDCLFDPKGGSRELA